MEGLAKHKLGPLTAGWFERSGLAVPAPLQEEQRSASLAVLIAAPLVRRIRAAAEGPLVLLKGPEVAALYPPGGRRFSDVDVLTRQAHAVQAALLQSGFIEVGDEDYSLPRDHHHLHPIRRPEIWLNVEVHSAPNWPVHAVKPAPLAEILEAVVPSALGIEGVFAPNRLHHTLIIASHAWLHGLDRLRDLVDIAVLADGVPTSEITRTAQRWGIGRLWRTTWATVEAYLYGGHENLSLRLLTPHLATARERTVFENHLFYWLYPYWELPAHRAFAETLRTVRKDLTPEADETWNRKFARIARAVRHPRTSSR